MAKNYMKVASPGFFGQGGGGGGGGGEFFYYYYFFLFDYLLTNDKHQMKVMKLSYHRQWDWMLKLY